MDYQLRSTTPDGAATYTAASETYEARITIYPSEEILDWSAGPNGAMVETGARYVWAVYQRGAVVATGGCAAWERADRLARAVGEELGRLEDAD